MQWAVFAAAGMVAFLAWDTAVRPISTAWSLEADQIEATVGQVRRAADIRDGLRRRNSPALLYGEVARPANDDEGRADLLQAVNEVVKNYQVSNDDFSLRARGRLRTGTLPTISRGRRIERINGELRFESSPEDALAIIADLESHPAVEAVTEVRIMNPVNRRVSVRLVVESWVISTGRSAT
jgi:hypothetical protein